VASFSSSIADNYLTFWFRYVFTNRTELETGNTNYVLTKIQEDYNTYLGHMFEQVASEFLTEAKQKKLLPFSFTTLGKWWFKNNEIDIIAIDEEKLATTFFEVKWATINEEECERIIKNLKAKASMFHLDRKKENFGVIAKKVPEKQHLRDKGDLAFDLEDFELIDTRNTNT
jgi:hypothetical protein